MRETLWANGYSDEQLERMRLKGQKKKTGHSSRDKAILPGHSDSFWKDPSLDTRLNQELGLGLLQCYSLLTDIKISLKAAAKSLDSFLSPSRSGRWDWMAVFGYSKNKCNKDGVIANIQSANRQILLLESIALSHVTSPSVSRRDDDIMSIKTVETEVSCKTHKRIKKLTPK